MMSLGFSSAGAAVTGGVAAPSVLDRVGLRAGAVWSSRDGSAERGVLAATTAPACIRVLGGAVWITQEGDGADYVLHAGEVFTARGDGLVVIEAIEDAQLAIRPRRSEW